MVLSTICWNQNLNWTHTINLLLEPKTWTGPILSTSSWNQKLELDPYYQPPTGTKNLNWTHTNNLLLGTKNWNWTHTKNLLLEPKTWTGTILSTSSWKPKIGTGPYYQPPTGTKILNWTMLSTSCWNQTGVGPGYQLSTSVVSNLGMYMVLIWVLVLKNLPVG